MVTVKGPLRYAALSLVLECFSESISSQGDLRSPIGSRDTVIFEHSAEIIASRLCSHYSFNLSFQSSALRFAVSDCSFADKKSVRHQNDCVVLKGFFLLPVCPVTASCHRHVIVGKESWVFSEIS